MQGLWFNIETQICLKCQLLGRETGVETPSVETEKQVLRQVVRQYML